MEDRWRLSRLWVRVPRLPPRARRMAALGRLDRRTNFKKQDGRGRPSYGRNAMSSRSSTECSPPCHGGDRGFKSHRGRLEEISNLRFQMINVLVEQRSARDPAKVEIVGSNPTGDSLLKIRNQKLEIRNSKSEAQRHDARTGIAAELTPR